MAIGETITLGSDAGITIGGVDENADPLNPTVVSTATVTGRLYDRKKIRELTADTDGDGASPTLVNLSSVEPYDVNDPFELYLDDGTFHNTTISSMDTATDVVTMAAAVPSGRIAKEKTFAKRKFGADISMATLYGGVPTVNSDTWGYSGVIADTHEGLHLGQKVRCEIEVDDGPGLRLFKRFDARVVS